MFDEYLGKVHLIRVHEGAKPEIGELIRREEVEGLNDIQVPVILAENGDEVYGYECWWTPWDQRIVDELNKNV